MITTLYFVRHAQPDIKCRDERTRPLTPQGKKDSEAVADVLEPLGVNAVVSSPFVRSYDTVAPLAWRLGVDIVTDERLRERKPGTESHDCLERRWADFDFCEPGRENLRQVQQRNMAAVGDMLARYAGRTVAVGSHGTALCTILNALDPAFGCDGFKAIYELLPYVVRLRYDGTVFLDKEEIFKLRRGY